jgi:hypothetical protein
MVEQYRNPGNGAPLRMFMLLITCWLMGRLVWEGAMLPDGSARDMESVGLQDFRSQGDLGESEYPHGVQPLKDTTTPSIIRSLAVPVNRVSVISFENGCCGAPYQRASTIALQQEQSRFGGGKAVHYDDKAQSEQPASKVDVRALGQASEFDLPKSNLPEGKALTGYAWFIVRQGSGQNSPLRHLAGFQLPGQLPGQSYGGSQAGGQLALRVVGRADRHLSLTARISTALASSGEEEIALGVKARPLRRIPISIHAEQRFDPGGARFRGTAVYAAGGTGPDPLPGQLTLETYGQGGYLFGNRNSYFFDAAVAVQRDVVNSDFGEVTAGLGLWAGGQRGVSRIDVGPSAKVILPLGETTARVGLDWRQRISGTARPGSGLTVSVSTGF